LRGLLISGRLAEVVLCQPPDNFRRGVGRQTFMQNASLPTRDPHDFSPRQRGGLGQDLLKNHCIDGLEAGLHKCGGGRCHERAPAEKKDARALSIVYHRLRTRVIP
jgi:hypothetical protein